PLSGINSPSRDGNPALSDDGLSLYFESDRIGGVGATDIWFATRDTGTAPFSGAVNFTAINSASTDGHPAISSDAQWLYYSSHRPGSGATGIIRRELVHCSAATTGQSLFPAGGGAATIAIDGAGSGCSWVAQTTSSWITLAPPASGSQPGTIVMTVDA